MSDVAPIEQPAKKRRGLGRATPVALVAMALPILGNTVTVAVAPFLATWLRDQGRAGWWYFTLTFAVAGALLIAPTHATSAIAGWVFGFGAGLAAVSVGVVGGATISYGLARRLARNRVLDVFRDHQRWDLVRRAVAEESPGRTLWMVCLLRLSPILPFGTTNVLLATTGVRFPIFVVGTLAGLLPRMALIAAAGAGAERLDLDSSAGWLYLAAGAAATVVCIAVIAVVGRRALRRATGAE